ncbi:GNAT family N-acetyltransferase [Leekyejoonella antrihumi]|uniref:GNAT family N-acetyltransferase n=1 Tax=Leekyejoonella antrihumi TaxID=1660198 RepID=A0A563DZD3_9MICO|nr:GNAT family N-acetyltransferase [Leekyejoonella antrihumi]
MLPLVAYGERVWVQSVTPADLTSYRVAVQLSAQRIGRWNPVNPDDLLWHLRQQSQDHRTFLVHAHQKSGGHDLVGKINVMNVVRGRFQSGTMGYDAYDPYAGTGLFAEGLRLTVGLAFASVPSGMGLHRVEADVRPGNETSAGVLRSLGFRREGHVRDMLWLESAGETRWRDHDTYAVTASDWPSPAFRPHAPLRITALVGGARGPERTALARRLALELGVPLFSSSILGSGADARPLWRLLADSPAGGVLEHSWETCEPGEANRELEAIGIRPGTVPEVSWALGSAAQDQLAGAGPVIEVDADARVSPKSVVALALRIRAIHVDHAL